MWTREGNRRLPVEEAVAELGLVTMGGDPTAVVLGGERRWLPVCSPGGWAWRPRMGERVLVLKAGVEKESPCVLGRIQDGNGLKPGEARLSGGKSTVFLGEDALELTGEIRVNGVPLEEYIRQIAAGELAEQEV